MRAKPFNCVEMKRQGAELVRKQLEGISFEEKLEYWRKGTEELKKLQTEAREKGSSPTKDSNRI